MILLSKYVNNGSVIQICGQVYLNVHVMGKDCMQHETFRYLDVDKVLLYKCLEKIILVCMCVDQKEKVSKSSFTKGK